MSQYKRALCWIRRDLRLQDHTALAEATDKAQECALVFVFDQHILSCLNDESDKRLTFIHESLEELATELQERDSRLIVLEGKPEKEIPALAKNLQVDAVFVNEDYEPAAITRDALVKKRLMEQGCEFHSFKDQCIFAGKEVQTGSGTAFKVFTPYKNSWREKLRGKDYEERKPKISKLLKKEKIPAHYALPSLEKIGFKKSRLWLDPGAKAARKRLTIFEKRIKDYKEKRDFPAAENTSGLSVHLRFGTISVRECLRTALEHRGIGAETWVNELIWRDFYMMILKENPHVVMGTFKKEYDKINWPGKEAHFQAWCEGQTGYPIVDAAMRHFNETGWMHNRLRMIVASFLTKDLLVHWQKGEKYFADKLLDFDLSANNGGWQWSASTGCDAQPYFRIFNPTSQSEKFDPSGEFIRQYVPELKSLSNKEIHDPKERSGLFGVKYPEPIVIHNTQRTKALELFKRI